MTFEVTPSDLVTAGKQVKHVGGTLPLIKDYVSTNVRISGGSGFFDNLKPEVDEIRTTLVSDYGNRTQRIFDGAGQGLIDTATSYDTVDAGSRASFDQLLPDDHEYDRPRGMDTYGETAGVDRSEFRSILEPPGTAYEDWEEFQEIRKGLDTILSWDWVFKLLGAAGVPNLSQVVADNLQGDWDAMGRTVASLEGISDYWSKARRELAASIHALDGTWSGNAANATFEWFSEFDDILFEHSDNISGVRQRLWGYAIGVRMCIDSLMSIVDSIVAFVIGNSGFPNGLQDVIQWLLTGAGKAILRKIFLFVDAFMAFFDLVMVLGGLMSMAFSQLAGHGDISVPDNIPAYTPSDVDGP